MKSIAIKIISFFSLFGLFLGLNVFRSVVVSAASRIYYVDQSIGDDSNDGLSENKPFKNIQPALNVAIAGDTVLVKNGTYRREHGFGFKFSGLPGKYITIKNYPGQSPFLTTNFWCVFCMSTKSYITIQGLSMSNTSVKGDSIDGSGGGIYMDKNSHHIKIEFNTIQKAGGAGIATKNADYITFNGNTVHNTSSQNTWGTSGISLLRSYNFDDHKSQTYHNIITNNVVYANEQTRPTASGCCIKVTDGNGIIIDSNNDSTYDQNAAYYTGKTLVANNLVVNNGGRGIALFQSDNVDVFNNTLYKNSYWPEIKDGDLSVNRSKNARVYNNLIQSRGDRPCGHTYLANNLAYDNNLCFSKLPSPFKSTNSIEVQPKFINPSSINVTKKGFEFSAASKGIDAGLTASILPSALTDLAGKPRILNNKIDIGALEYQK